MRCGSTADSGSTAAQQAGGGQHFDGIVDPAGWYDSNGNLLPGTFKDAGGNPVAIYTGSNFTAAQLTNYLTNDYFTPNAANPAHDTFYGYVNGDYTTATPGTLMGFIQAPGVAPIANSSGINHLQVAPGVELDNPVSAGINNGDIKVLTNWNLGALDNQGNLLFRNYGWRRTSRCGRGGDVVIDACISDGFAQNGATPICCGRSSAFWRQLSHRAE